MRAIITLLCVFMFTDPTLLSMEMLPHLSAKTWPRPSMEMLPDLALPKQRTHLSPASLIFIYTFTKIPTKSLFSFLFTKYLYFFLIRMCLQSYLLLQADARCCPYYPRNTRQCSASQWSCCLTSETRPRATHGDIA